MDWGQATVAGSSGGLGALAGAILALMIGIAAPRARSALIIVFAMIGASLGSAFGEPYVDHYAGARLRALVASSASAEEVSAEIRRSAMYRVILDRRPDLEGELADVLTTAGRDGGAEGVREAAFLWGSERLSVMFAEVAPHGRDQDLLAWMRGASDVLAELAEDDPLACHDFVFGARTGHRPDRSAWPPKLQAEMTTLANEAMVPVIENAGASFVRPWTEDDETLFMLMAQGVMTEVGPHRIQYLQGVRPSAAGDARAVCRAMAGLYADIAEHPRGGAMARLMLSQ